MNDSKEPFGILNENGLYSAAEKPWNVWSYGEEENIVVLAVTLLAGLAHNHPFLEGNKRTALIAARTFLISNGFDITVSDEDLGPAVKAFVEGHLAEADLVDLLEEHLESLY